MNPVVDNVRNSLSDSSMWALTQLSGCPVVSLSIDSITVGDTPRASGEIGTHARMLAELTDALPPIVVHKPSTRVIDGAHRVHAARLRGQETISALVYSGPLEDAFVLAVRLNTHHGLPLSREDRTSATARIVKSHPQWSDRMVASIVGLAPGTVSSIRRRTVGKDLETDSRLGRDGRRRPVNSAEGRLRARQLWGMRPNATAREIAKEAGVSAATALNVRHRLEVEHNSLPTCQPVDGESTSTTKPHDIPRPRNTSQPTDRNRDTTGALASLMKDPSIRLNDTGRFLLRLLEMNSAGAASWDRITAQIPAHSTGLVAELAHQYAQMWSNIASQLDRQNRRSRPPTV
jgi:hypothetical protein